MKTTENEETRGSIGSTENFSINCVDDDSEDDREDFKPTIDHLMDENVDMGMEISDYDEISSPGVSYRENEIEDLIKESEMPLDEILNQYYQNALPYLSDEQLLETDLMEYERRKRKIAKSYVGYFGEPEDFDKMLEREPETIPIGPNHQVVVPEATYNTPLEELDELIYDPYVNPQCTFDEFFALLKAQHPAIRMQDEMVMNFYTRHRGDIQSALMDQDSIRNISKVQSSPLTDWTVNECLQFKNAIIRFKKNFNSIQEILYPNRSLKEIIEFYYVWKTSPLYDDYLIEISEDGTQQRGTYNSNSPQNDVYQGETNSKGSSPIDHANQENGYENGKEASPDI